MTITLARNIGLDDAATSTRTASVCEPTTAANERQLMMTGNWFASTSTDGGATLDLRRPVHPLSGIGRRLLLRPGGSLQSALPDLDLAAAVHAANAAGEQYLPSCGLPRHPNSAAGTTGTLLRANLNAGWNQNWFDYPDMAFTNDNLFVTFNVFLGDDWQRAVVFRFPARDASRPARSLGYRWWTTTSNGSHAALPGPRRRHVLGQPQHVSQLRVFQWADNSTCDHAERRQRSPLDRRGLFGSRPGRRQLARSRWTSRITGAWVGNGVIGFMWSANRDTRTIRCRMFGSSGLTRPPRRSSTSRTSGAVLSAWAYPAAAPNSRRTGGLQRLLRRRYAPPGPCRRRPHRQRLGGSADPHRARTVQPTRRGGTTCPASHTQPAGPLGRRRIHASGRHRPPQHRAALRRVRLDGRDRLIAGLRAPASGPPPARRWPGRAGRRRRSRRGCRSGRPPPPRRAGSGPRRRGRAARGSA